MADDRLTPGERTTAGVLEMLAAPGGGVLLAFFLSHPTHLACSQGRTFCPPADLVGKTVFGTTAMSSGGAAVLTFVVGLLALFVGALITDFGRKSL